MTKRFFYTAMGILGLALAYNLGANRAEAGFADTNIGIRAVSTSGEYPVLLMDDGTILYFETSNGTFETVDQPSPLPVPPSEVLLFETNLVAGSYRLAGSLIVTTSGIAYHYPFGGGWQNLGPVPGIGPVPVESQSFGSIKGAFRR